jgi:hypothetical protein
MRLGTILDEEEAAPVADLLDGSDVHRLPEEVDRDDRLGLPGDLRFDAGRVDMEISVEVDEYGPGARLADRLGRGDEAVGDGDDLVARADAQGLEGDIDGIRPVGATDAVPDPELLREGLLEAVDVPPPTKAVSLMTD